MSEHAVSEHTSDEQAIVIRLTKQDRQNKPCFVCGRRDSEHPGGAFRRKHKPSLGPYTRSNLRVCLNCGKLLADNDTSECIPLSDNPRWHEAGEVHDWRNYISEAVRSEWSGFTQYQRDILKEQAEYIAGGEEWE